jgi:5'-3' exonuclease
LRWRLYGDIEGLRNAWRAALSKMRARRFRSRRDARNATPGLRTHRDRKAFDSPLPIEAKTARTLATRT